MDSILFLLGDGCEEVSNNESRFIDVDDLLIWSVHGDSIRPPLDHMPSCAIDIIINNVAMSLEDIDAGKAQAPNGLLRTKASLGAT